MTTIKLKNGSGAPTSGDLAQGEPALDLTNKRLYTEDSGGTVIEVGTNPGVDVTFADNRKAIFGAGSDLEIYHDGSNSFIRDAGTGNLVIRGTSLNLQKDGGESYITMVADGAVTAYYDNSARLATSSTGIDVTGTVTADGLTVQGASDSTVLVEATGGNDASLFLTEAGTGNVGAQFVYDGGVNELFLKVGNNTDTTRLSVSRDTGDISFYEDTGTTAKLFWDASAESLGIGTSSPASILSTSGTDTTAYSASSVGGQDSAATLKIQNLTTSANSFASIDFNTNNNRVVNRIVSSHGSSTTNGFLAFVTEGSGTPAERMRIDSSGNVGIGTSNPAKLLETVATGAGSDITALQVRNNSSNTSTSTSIRFVNSTVNTSTAGGAEVSAIRNANDGGSLTFKTATNSTATLTEAMRIDSSGNLLVGTTDTDTQNNNAGSTADNGFAYNIGSGGYLNVARYGGTVAYFNRTSTDGTIADFRKDGATVGQINARSGDLVIGTGTTGLQFYDVGNAIFPLSASGNTNRDAAIDLGEGSNRFKDLYLSGRVIANGVTTSAHAWSSESDSTSSSAHLYFRNPNGFVGNIATSGTATAYNTSSDYRLKENAVAITGATDRLKQLSPKRFNFIADADTTVDGFMAHEVQSVVPEAITGTHNEVDDEGNPVYQAIDQSKLVPLLVATIQELEARITALETN